MVEGLTPITKSLPRRISFPNRYRLNVGKDEIHFEFQIINSTLPKPISSTDIAPQGSTLRLGRLKGLRVGDFLLNSLRLRKQPLRLVPWHLPLHRGGYPAPWNDKKPSPN